MAPTAAVFCTSGTAPTTPNSTLLRPAHCISAVTGEPPTSPTAACRISRAEASWKRPAAGGRCWLAGPPGGRRAAAALPRLNRYRDPYIPNCNMHENTAEAGAGAGR